MAWVDRHERTNVQALAALVAIGAHVRPGGAPRLVVDCKVAQEALAIDGNEIEHEPSWLPLDRIQHERLVDPDRAGGIEHDARAALHHQPEAERLDEPAPGLTGLRRQVKVDLRQVDDDPIRIGQRESREIDGAAQVDHESGAILVSAEAGIAGDRHVGRPALPVLRRPGRPKAGQEDPAHRGEPPACFTKPHDFPPVPYLLHRTAWLICI